MIKKVLSGFAAVFFGGLAWVTTKYLVLILGFFVLSSAGISGPIAAADLEATAEILGLLIFLVTVKKIYHLAMVKKDGGKDNDNDKQLY